MHKQIQFLLPLFVLFGLLFLTTPKEAKAQCGMALRDVVVREIGEAKYLKDFRVRLEPGPKKAPPTKEFAILLNKGTKYRFNIRCDSSMTDQVILKLFDFTKPYGSNYDPDDGMSYDAFEFFCSKTQVYYLAISFAGASPGCAAAVVSYVSNYDAN